MSADTEPIATLLASAWRTRTLIDTIDAAALPSNRAQAYAIQEEMVRKTGEPIDGWKVGAVAEAVQRAEGFDGPIPGMILHGTLRLGDARFQAAELPEAKLECEYAFRFLDDMPLERAPYTGDDLAGRVAFHIAFDITSTRVAPAFTASLDKLAAMRLGIADNGNGGAIAIGAEIAHWRDLDLLSLGVEMDLNGSRFNPVFTGENRADPVATLVDTVNDLASRGLFFRAGTYLLTGSLTAPQTIGKSDRAVVDFEAMGRLAVELI
jgi:2-keto-4-pentenoate hydratase